ncbi:calcium-binding protein [Nocardia sp. NPDC058176]|uniref:calcium-binding protein n=1 Tax=Nocardia sp. NPDC058176 TaxID=3346368 RepID=UPI0036D97BBE
MTHSRAKSILLTPAAGILLLTACGGADEPAAEAVPSAQNEESGAYTPGEYQAEGSYQTPGGTQKVGVTVTLAADGTVDAVRVDPRGTGGSLALQARFAGGIANEVVGKKIDELNVTKVSGSSLTSGGFNAAIESIKNEAAA